MNTFPVMNTFPAAAACLAAAAVLFVSTPAPAAAAISSSTPDTITTTPEIAPTTSTALTTGTGSLEDIVAEAIRPVMKEHAVPGMAVAVTVGGERFLFTYGTASPEGGEKVTTETLFEIGSLSKTFTAALGSWGEARGVLSLSDKASGHWSALAGSAFDKVPLRDLATYTAGGLPLQFPDAVTDGETMTAWYRCWRPDHAPGTHRRYSNPSIGLFGHLVARSMGEPFDRLMETKLFPALGLSRTFLRVPPERMGDYAFGTSKEGKPIRVTPGVLDAQAYGVKTTAADLLRFVEANMNAATGIANGTGTVTRPADGTVNRTATATATGPAAPGLDPVLRRALAATHTGYYRVGPMTQGLGWEMYPWPTTLDTLLAGNAAPMAFEAHEVTPLQPPRPPRPDVLLNKTGSTNGFGAYAVFVPARGIGVVLLANRNYPIPSRVRAAWQILSALDRRAGEAARTP